MVDGILGAAVNDVAYSIINGNFFSIFTFVPDIAHFGKCQLVDVVIIVDFELFFHDVLHFVCVENAVYHLFLDKSLAAVEHEHVVSISVE